MYNHINCSHLLFGPKVGFAIAYKVNQVGFHIYTREHFHNFKVQINNKNFEGSLGCNLPNQKCHIISEKQDIIIGDNDDFQVKQQLSIPNSNDGLEILHLAVSHDESKIGVAIGNKLIRDQIKVSEIAIYGKNHLGKYELEKICDWGFEDTCEKFHFDCKDPGVLLLFSKTRLFMFYYNDQTKDLVDVKVYSEPLRGVPKFAVMNKTQRKFVIATDDDALLVDFDMDKLGKEIDVEGETQLSGIEAVLAGEKNFYIFANKHLGQLGYFLLVIPMATPTPEHMRFLLKFENKLDVRDADLSLMKLQEPKLDQPSEFEENLYVIVSFKTMGINTYNVITFDLKSEKIKYWHESY